MSYVHPLFSLLAYFVFLQKISIIIEKSIFDPKWLSNGLQIYKPKSHINPLNIRLIIFWFINFFCFSLI